MGDNSTPFANMKMQSILISITTPGVFSKKRKGEITLGDATVSRRLA